MFRQTVLLALFFFAASCGYPGVASAPSTAAIHSFTVSPASITVGQTATLAASFSNGTGTINQGIGPILSGASVTVSPSSTTTYALTVTDAAARPVTRTATVTVASTGGAPVVSITSSPPSLTNQTMASFSFSSNKAGSTFSCKLDSGAVAACTSPQSYSALAAGSHTFTLTATDMVGNASAPASFTWSITLTGGLVISSPLVLDKLTVRAGDILNGTVSYQNTSASPIAVQTIGIAARPPGGTNAGGPYSNLTPSLPAQTI